MEVVMTNLAVDLSGLDALVQSRIPAAVRVLGEAVRSSCDPYVPYRTGRLANSAVLESSGDGTGASLTWTAPYASECYYASRAFNQKIHPHACAHWFEAAKAADLTLWEEAAAGVLGSPTERITGVVGKDGTSLWKN